MSAKLKVVIQEDVTGCGLAAVANIVNVPYQQVKQRASDLGIFVEDQGLFSSTAYVRRLLGEYGVSVAEGEIRFERWEALPDTALLALKYRVEQGRPLWHWAVFKRIDGKQFVLDSAAYLDQNIRVDFNTMNPKWYIGVG